MAQDISWASLADVGYGLVGGLTKGLSALGSYKVSKANADAENLIRAGRNEVAHSQASLAATVKSINNSRIMSAAAEQREALVTTALRTSDSFTRRSFEDTIQASEQLGRVVASQGSAGLGGSAIQAVSQTTQLRTERAAEAVEQAQGQQLSDMGFKAAGIIPQAVRQLDVSPITINTDFNRSAPRQAQPNLAGMLVEGVLSKKDSLQTFLGSLTGYDSPATQPAGSGAYTTPVEAPPSVETRTLAPFAFTDDALGTTTPTTRIN